MAPIGIGINGQIMEPIMAGKSSSWFDDFPSWDFMGRHGKTIVIPVYSILYHSYKSFLVGYHSYTIEMENHSYTVIP